ncbi:MAG: MATE family efflux transporter [Coriobacteriales bacterium]|jgi:putative MATE family efflux protein|nr:MATE family efflux transporter [Coriobacteriales bacterium]
MPTQSDKPLPTEAHTPPLLSDAHCEVDPELQVDLREDEDYTPDEPVSKHGIQYAKKHDQVDRMGTDKLGRLILEFAIPSIIGMLVNGFYNIIDSVFLGLKLGEVGLATATVATPVMIMSMAVSILVGAGGNALAAIKLGEGKREAAERVMGNTFILALALAALSTIAIQLFMDPVLHLSGSTEEVHGSAHVFVSIISWGFILQFFGMGFNNFMRTAGDPNRALYTMVIGVLVCTVLNYLFVMVLEFGIAGSAWATIIGQGVSAATIFYYFTASKKAPFKLRRRFFKVNPRLMVNICALGSAPFFLQLAFVIINLILNNQLVIYGATEPIGSSGALAAIGVVQRIAMFSFFPILGTSIAVQPIFGYNYGAQLFARVKRTFVITLIWMVAFGVFFWLLVHLFPQPIVAAFGVEAELYDFTIKATQVQMFFMPLIGLQVLVSGYFQSTGQPLKSMFVSLTRQLLYLIPLLYFLPLVIANITAAITPLESLYYAYPIADLFSIITSGGMIMLEWRRLNRRIAAQHESGPGKPAVADAAS